MRERFMRKITKKWLFAGSMLCVLLFVLCYNRDDDAYYRGYI